MVFVDVGAGLAQLRLAGLLVASPYLLGRSLLRHRHAREAAGDSAVPSEG